MQFVTDGPDIPDALVQAHEEGRVVFFCGAGIAYPAGLPGFKGLVEEIYRLNGTAFTDIEREAFERGQFDATLDLLERRLPGQRLAVRRALEKALRPKLRRKGAIDTQAALLRLARSRDGMLRLVTTNFDRVFHAAAKRTGQAFQSYTAPMLPIPKNSRWNGLVYLHGLLSEKTDDTALNRLVITSGDFGLAYLTERWAARFVSELFRNYVVCFVGYSINDPVLRYMMDALTTTLRLELRELLAPQVVLKEPFRWGEEEAVADEPTRLRQLVDWELALATDHVHAALRDLAGDRWASAQPMLLDDFQQLLRDALDMLRELGEADDRSDRSHWDLPSISPHWQNRGFRDWVSLIELLRDAWLAILVTDGARATRIALGWFELPYPTFKRLALFAASQNATIQPEQWVGWLLADEAWWLWSTDTGREVLRLLALQGWKLSGSDQERLEAAILAGPPRTMYREDLEPDRWQDLVARSVWLHLAKLNSSGLALGAAANERMRDLSNACPQWKLAPNERNEFSHWMSGTGDPDYEDRRDIAIAPRKRRELVEWLVQPQPEGRPFYEDTWRVVCRKHLLNSLYALCDLARDDVWPLGRWRDALQAWSEERIVKRSWLYAAPLVQTMADTTIQELVHGVTWWIEAASKSIKRHEDILLDLCRRVLSLPLEPGTGMTRNGEPMDQPVTEAINHPIGHITQALINFWLKRKPNDNDLLPAEIEPLFTQVCDVRVNRFRHGRVLLGSRLIALFRVDRPWTEQYLLPLASWNNPTEAKAVWEGFLWSPRLYQPLLTAFKPQFLACASHYAELGEHGQQLATILTYAALGPTDGYSAEDFRSAIGALPQEGLEESAQSISQALEGAAEQREDYWRNRVLPFWQQVWPKSRDLATPRIAESLTRLAIAARGEFPAAVAAVQDWLRPIEHPHYVVHLLQKSGLCKQFPTDALVLLNAVIADQQWAPQELDQCLNEIEQAEPQLAHDASYRRLREYARRRRG